MWTRAELKTRAKEVLKGSYWKAFLVSLVIASAGGGSGGGGSYGRSFNSGSADHGIGSQYVPIIIAVVMFIIVIALAFRIFLGYPLEVGGRRYFSRSAQNDVNLNYLGFGFGKGIYMDVIKTMFRRSLQNWLWYLLLIIPGIIKYYAYSMVPYILGDNPNIGSKRAIELSKQMTDGQKMMMWVLDLSFLGWYLLGLLACCIGVLFVMPYENATKGELYLVLRQNALDQGWTSEEELQLNSSI